MKKINIDKINMKFYSDKYIYIVSLIYEEIIIKRIDVVNNKNIIIFNINDFDIKSYPALNNEIEQYNILKEVINNLKQYCMFNDVIDINKLEYSLNFFNKKAPTLK